MHPKNKKIGLALGSGAARGFVHIGIIKVLEKNNIPIDFIAGSSIGALVGGIYAATKDVAYLEKLALNTDWVKMIKLIDPAFGNGLIAGDKVKDFIRQALKGASFTDLRIPFSVVATDIISGDPVIFRGGDIVSAIRASISIPFIFHTVPFKEKMLCDGALSMPIPVPAAIQMGAEYIIAVDIDSDYLKQKHKKPKDNLIDIGHNIIMLLSSHLSKENMQKADLVLTPRVGDVEWNSFGSKDTVADLIARGEKIMEEALPRYFETIKPQTRRERLKEFLGF